MSGRIAIEMTPEMIALCCILHDSRPIDPGDWSDAVKGYSRGNAAGRRTLKEGLIIAVSTRYDESIAQVIPQFRAGRDANLPESLWPSAVADLIAVEVREMIAASDLRAIEERAVMQVVLNTLRWKVGPDYTEGSANWSTPK